MKKLLFVLFFIPALLCGQTKEGVKIKEKARKAAIANLKKVLKKYPHWKWDGRAEGEKTLVISGRTNTVGPFSVKLYSENNPHKFFFKPGIKATTDDGKNFDPMKNIFVSDFFAFKYLTSYFGSQNGKAYQIRIDTAGIKDIQAAALDVLLA